MNFYIGNSIESVDANDMNIEFNDELLHFLYEQNTKISFDLNKLVEIDPYNDIKISNNTVTEIIKICNYILNNSLLKNYKYESEAIDTLKNLIKISQKAISENMGLISIGD